MAGRRGLEPSEILPDILNAHLPPPYSALPPGNRRLPPPPPCGGTILPPCPHSPPRRSRFRPFPPRDRLRSSGRGSESEEPKHCCGVMVTQTVSIRWFIVMIAFVGLCCAIVGTVLGVLKATGREHLTVSLLMIGVGIVLITVSGIAWKLTAHDAPSCRVMLGFPAREPEPNRRFVPRVSPYGRPHHPYAAMMYPEFHYRPPPPSYQASMQEYRLRLLLLDRQQGANAPQRATSPVSPPPTYRSHGTLHSRPPLTLERDHSRPPSYRSRASSAGALRPANSDTLDTPGESTSHSRNPSLSLSFLSHDSLLDPRAAPIDTSVHFTSPSGESLVAGLSDDSPPWRGDLWNNLRKNPDVNAVTIVQTTESSQVLNQDSVIVACHSATPGEVHILGHV